MNSDINNIFHVNQIGTSMNNYNLMNNMHQIQNQINPLIYFNNIPNQMNNINQFNPNIQISTNFINPYQRISELENIIIQKNLEIEDLKRQLQSNNKDLTTILNDNKSLELKFIFIPLENSKKIFEFQQTCYKDEKFITVKKRISKKLNKNLKNLIFKYNKGGYIYGNSKVGNLFHDSIVVIKEVVNQDDYISSDDSEDYDNLEKINNANWEIGFKFIPLENPKNEINFKEICNPLDKIIKVKKKIALKLNKHINYLKLLFNGYEIYDRLTFAQTGIMNGSSVIIKETNKSIKAINEEDNLSDDDENMRKEKMNILFSYFSSHEYFITYKNTPIGIVLLFFMLQNFNSKEIMNYINGKGNISFLYNCSKIDFHDDRKVGKMFADKQIPKIIVNKY